MGEAIGQVLSFGVGVALSPVPIIAVILMLVTQRARANGPAFVLGWLIGLAIVGAMVLLLADPAGANDDGRARNLGRVLEVVLGALAILLGLKQWRGRPKTGDEPAETPKWMAAMDTFTAPKALGMGVSCPASTRRTCSWRSGPRRRSLSSGSPAASRRSHTRCSW